MRKTLSNFFALAKLLRGFGWRSLLLAVIVTLNALTGIAVALAMRTLLDSVISGDGELLTGFLVTGSALLAGIILGFISGRMRPLLGLRVINTLKAALFNRVLNADTLFLGGMHSGDFSTRMSGDVAGVASIYSNHIPDNLAILFQMAAAMLVISGISPLIAVAVAAAAPLFLLIGLPFFIRLRRYNKQSQKMISELQSFSQESYQNVRVIKAFDAKDAVLGRYGSMLGKILALWKKRCNLDAVVNTLLNVMYHGTYLAVIGLGVTFIQNKTITVGTAVAFFQLATMIQTPVFSLIRTLPQIMAASVSVDRLHELLASPQEETPETEQGLLKGPCGLKIEGLDYSYNVERRIVFKGFDALIEPGSFTAIIGLSGQGKTTLFMLLLAMLRPDAGTLSIYDRAGNTVPVSVPTRNVFSYIPQGNSLLSGTIRENLCLGGRTYGEDELAEALRAVEIWEHVSGLPDGMDSSVGERGMGMSEGQAQRVAIARALLRKPQILLMDEATSALDEPTEEKILHNIRVLLADSTIVMITHRMHAARICDKKISI
jgi:ABC-type multidrug transport system fused ATPase/permease subunit